MATILSNEHSSGWEYISAIFCYFQDCILKKSSSSHIVPKYIYRGISKRYFTESKLLNDFIALLKTNKPLILNDVDITDSLYPDYEVTIKKFEQYAIEFPYNNTHELVNGLTIDELKQQKKSHILYGEIYTRLKHKIADSIHRLKNDTADTTNIIQNVRLLQEINGWIENQLTQPEQVRSGASVRLRDVDKKYFSITDYISYINNLIYDFKKINPEFKNYSELEILAEIQHRGGASCLVDFSKNFLISLWFASNNDNEDPGYLFCYNVNQDALLDDNISYLNRDRWSYDIEDLLQYTRKTSIYSDEEKFRFWLWKPANINGRIARQDSIFVFGLEKFFTKDHHVDIITIPGQWKRAIVTTLKNYFGITSETVFPDVDGYAVAHSKISKIDQVSQYLNLKSLSESWKSQNFNTILQRGMSCLLNGQYRIALDYFLKIYSEKESLYDNRLFDINYIDKNNLSLIRLEILYSIGLCYKKIEEYNNAEHFLNKAFCACFEIKTGYKLNSRGQIEPHKSKSNSLNSDKALLPKFLKIVDDYLDVLNELNRYGIARAVISLLLDNHVVIGEYALKCTNQRLIILETIQKVKISKEKFFIPSLSLNTKGWPSIFIGLNLYHNLIRCILNSPEDIISEGKIKADTETRIAYKEFKKFVDTSLSNPTNLQCTNLKWPLSDIQESIKAYYKKPINFYIQKFVDDVTSQMKTLMEIIESRNRS